MDFVAFIMLGFVFMKNHTALEALRPEDGSERNEIQGIGSVF